MANPVSATGSTSSTGLTPSSTPLQNATKRLSTIKTPGSPKGGGGPKGTAASATATGVGMGGGVKDVVSPGELCGFVDTLLSQLETRFDEMSEQVLTKMNEMSNRIDNLETTIQDLMTGDLDGPSPAPVSSGSRQASVSAASGEPAGKK